MRTIQQPAFNPLVGGAEIEPAEPSLSCHFCFFANLKLPYQLVLQLKLSVHQPELGWRQSLDYEHNKGINATVQLCRSEFQLALSVSSIAIPL
jgi:hypothetical protein